MAYYLIPKYNVRQDQDDFRDLPYPYTHQPLKNIVDLRNYCSPIQEQLHLGSCTANALVGAYELLLHKEHNDQYIDLSRLFVYYNSRLIEDSIKTDSGAYIRDTIKAVAKYGVCSESLWPYYIQDYTIAPSIESYNDAKHRKIQKYYRITSIDDTLDALNRDIPVIFSFKVYKSFDELYFFGTTIKIAKVDESPIGAHAMCIVGYDLPSKLLICRNSFGTDWAMDGYCYMPFDYYRKEIIDCWIFDVLLIE